MTAASVALLALLAASACAPFVWLRVESTASASQVQTAWVSLSMLILLASGMAMVTLLPAESFDLHLGPVTVQQLGLLYTFSSFASFIGGPVFLLLLGGCMAAWLRSRGMGRRAALLLGCIGGEFASCALAKHLVARPRPPAPLESLADFSFPSGHASNSVLVYGMLIVLLCRGQQIGRIRALLAPAFIVFVSLMGVSRLLLRVHWMLDVLSGLALGGFWLGLFVLTWNGQWAGTDSGELVPGREDGVVAGSVAR